MFPTKSEMTKVRAGFLPKRRSRVWMSTSWPSDRTSPTEDLHHSVGGLEEGDGVDGGIRDGYVCERLWARRAGLTAVEGASTYLDGLKDGCHGRGGGELACLCTAITRNTFCTMHGNGSW